MTYYLYRKPDGRPDISQHELPPEMIPGYTLVRTTKDKPDVYGKRFNDQNELVRDSDVPEYVEQRRAAYPSTVDQLDALWHAMDDGVLPIVEPFYSDIKAVKEQYPKPSN